MPEPNSESGQTALHARHLALGAVMKPFAGWDMPLWYPAGAIREHLAVIRAAGLFDTGHMDVLFVTGPDARAFLDFAFTRSLARARPGRAAYGAFLNESGHALDDAIVYPFPDDRFAVVVNAAMGPVIRDHLARLPGGERVRVAAPDPRPAKLDIQGPASARILAGLLEDAREVLASFPYFTFKGDFDFGKTTVRLADGTPILLSRTGYTGELGFELFLPAERAGAVWDALLAAGSPAGLLPCGLAARDSLRTGAVLPLSHQDIGPWPFINHPWTFALPLAPDGTFTKAFVGADALDPATSPHTLPFVGFDPRRVDPGTAKAFLGDREVGTVTTIVTDMAMERVDGRVVGLADAGRSGNRMPRGLACGFVRVDRLLEPETELTLRDGRRALPVRVVTDIRPGRTARKTIDLV